jgi:hypothetical protein
MLTIKKSSYSFRYNNTVNIPRVNTTRYGLHSLRYGAAKLWNELPNDLREGINFAIHIFLAWLSYVLALFCILIPTFLG